MDNETELSWRECRYYRDGSLKNIEYGDIIVSRDHVKPVCITNYEFDYVKGVHLDGNGEVVEVQAPFGDCVIVYRPSQVIADLTAQLEACIPKEDFFKYAKHKNDTDHLCTSDLDRTILPYGISCTINDD